MIDVITRWFRDNWNEGSNLGKVKIAAVLVLVFLFISSLLHDRQDRAPEQVAGDEPAQQDGSAASMEQAEEQAAIQARAAYQDYEDRVSELEHELESARQQTGKAYADYEARVAELERGHQDDSEERDALGGLKAAADDARNTYEQYAARVGDLEQQLASARSEARDAYASYEARVSELEQAQARAEGEAAKTYASYEARVADLERENAGLKRRLAASDKQIEALKQGDDDAALQRQLKQQLESLKARIDDLLEAL